ncbi:ATP-binding protein [Winogradskyella sp.]|uniref:sensor histidine kinase n=1 Tax=Winogradskyella sp. TaxID=1883156 RepID=UPI003F6B1714
MSQKQIDIFQRALIREKQARKAAESILEEKSNFLYESNKKLARLYSNLESDYTRTNSELQGVFENIVDAYVITDLNGNILRMNKSAMSLLNISEKYPDVNLIKMVHHNDVDYLKSSIRPFLKQGFIKNFEVRLITNTNDIKTVHINASVIYDKEKPVAAQGILRDITEIKDNALIVDLINNTALAVLGKLDIDEIASAIVEQIAKFLNTNDCVVYLCDAEKRQVQQIAAYGKNLNEDNKLTFSFDNGVVGRVAHTRKSEIVNDTRLDKDYLIDDNNRLSEITVPILLGDAIIGIIDAEHPDRNYFTSKHIEILNSIASLVALQLKSAIDLKERIEVEKNLKKTNSELDTLIYRVSHDLRTPLLSIISLIDLIKLNTDVDIGAQNKEFIGLIQGSASRLDNSIKEILNYSRNSRLDLEPSAINLPVMVQTICDDLRYVNSAIAFNFNFNGIGIITVDKMRLETVLKNLLSNAVKYQKKTASDPELHFTISENQSEYCIVISDNGIGMSETGVKKMFDMFYRGTSDSKGTGLGLFIVKEMIDKLNGNIEVESQIDVGTTFTLTLPKH